MPIYIPAIGSDSVQTHHSGLSKFEESEHLHTEYPVSFKRIVRDSTHLPTWEDARNPLLDMYEARMDFPFEPLEWLRETISGLMKNTCYRRRVIALQGGIGVESQTPPTAAGN